MKNNTNKIKTYYQLQSEITLDGDRFFRPGEKYSFRLKIEHLESVLYIRRLCLLLK